MKQYIKYIFVVFCFLTGCQKAELLETPSGVPGEGVYGETTVYFSIADPSVQTQTKLMGEDPTDIISLHLIVFDENGYYIETREASPATLETSDGHPYERGYTVELGQTDKKRIIHFIANCPIGQIAYGPEHQIISNLYVTGNNTAYWSRIEVPYIKTKPDGQNLVDEISSKFKCVPLLRNFAQVTALDEVPDTGEHNFVMTSFAVYNTIDIGTVAPYNKSNQTFQLFYDGDLYTYDELLANRYEGHALSMATLDGTLVDGPGETDFIAPGQPFYMYERKISLSPTDNENQWDESPVHIIIKGKYNGSKKDTYYKIDLIRDVDGAYQYYNILRNFKYEFILHEVRGPGYDTLSDAMKNPAGNNLAGATDTQGFTNLSDGKGRIFVSYTDTTLTSSDNIKLKYKYIPDLSKPNVVNNSLVTIKPALPTNGTVIKSLVSTSGPDAEGWTTLEFSIQPVKAITEKQEVRLFVSDNSNLHKNVNFRLQRPLTMGVVCNPKVVPYGVGENVNLQITLPPQLTEDMFPLDLAIETDKLSLGPDASQGQTLPVENGKSIIPGKERQSFYFIYSIETYDDYLRVSGDGKNETVINTPWLTNTYESASYVVVFNKYFKVAGDYFVNVAGQELENPWLLNFGAELGRVKYGAGQTVDFEFNMSTLEPVTITLTGLEPAVGSSLEHVEGNIYTYNPTQAGVQTLQFRTTGDEGEVSVVLEAASYATSTSSATQTRPYFIIDGTGFSKASLGQSANEEVTFTFTLSDYEDGMIVDVALEGLVPADDKLAKVTRDAVTYRYEPKAPECVLNLKTETSGAKTCSVQLSADEYYYNQSEKKTIEQKQKTVTSTLTFDNTSKRTSRNNQQQVWTENNITFTNNKNSGTNVANYFNPIRLYSRQNVIVSVPSEGVITKIVFTCSTNNYANTLLNSIDNSATRSGSTVTVTLNGTSSEYTIASLSGEVRLSSITVTYEE